MTYIYMRTVDGELAGLMPLMPELRPRRLGLKARLMPLVVMLFTVLASLP